MIRLIWDFHGADAIQIAEHHARHLEDFLKREKIAKASSGVDKVDEGYGMAWVEIQEQDMEKVRDALKPQRGERV